MSIITKVFSFFMSLLLTLLGTTGLTVSQRAKALRVVAYIIAENAAMMEAVDLSLGDDGADDDQQGDDTIDAQLVEDQRKGVDLRAAAVLGFRLRH